MAPTTRPKKDIDYAALASGRMEKPKPTSKSTRKTAPKKAAPKKAASKKDAGAEYEGTIIQENKVAYLINWADGPNGEEYEPSWQFKKDANDAMIKAWEDQKAGGAPDDEEMEEDDDAAGAEEEEEVGEEEEEAAAAEDAAATIPPGGAHGPAGDDFARYMAEHDEDEWDAWDGFTVTGKP